MAAGLPRSQPSSARTTFGMTAKRRNFWIGSGIAAGIAIGVGIGVAMHNIGAGIAIGIAIGAGLEASRKKDASGRSDRGKKSDQA